MLLVSGGEDPVGNYGEGVRAVEEMLKTAGLSVAMGNASEDIKEICDIETADNDHAGVGNVIRKYLLDDPLYGVIRKP